MWTCILANASPAINCFLVGTSILLSLWDWLVVFRSFQYSGAPRPRPDSRCQGDCRVNWAASSWRWLRTRGLQQVGPDGVRHWPTHQQGYFAPGAFQVSGGILLWKVQSSFWFDLTSPAPLKCCMFPGSLSLCPLPVQWVSRYLFLRLHLAASPLFAAFNFFIRLW